MKEIFHSALGFHILIGWIALGSFWLTALAKKGSVLHRRTGWIYFYSIFVLMVTSFILATINIFDSTEVFPLREPLRVRDLNIYYFYSAAFAFSLAVSGTRPIRHKDNPQRLENKRNYWMNVVAGLLGLAVGSYGLYRHILVIVIGAGFLGISQIFGYFLLIQKLVEKRITYLQLHAFGMLVSGLTVHMAFISGGAMFLYFPWLGETHGTAIALFLGVFGSYSIYLACTKLARRIGEEDPAPL